MPQLVRFKGVIYRINANQDGLEWCSSGSEHNNCWSWAGFPNDLNVYDLQIINGILVAETSEGVFICDTPHGGFSYLSNADHRYRDLFGE
jgi:hypothetical protein